MFLINAEIKRLGAFLRDSESDVFWIEVSENPLCGLA